MTATSIAPYLDLGVTVVAELELTVEGEFEVVLEPELVVAVAPPEAAVVLADPEPVAVDMVVAAVEFPVAVPVADEVTVELPVNEPDEVWAKTAPDVEEPMLEVTEDAATEEETDLPLQEPEILMLW